VSSSDLHLLRRRSKEGSVHSLVSLLSQLEQEVDFLASGFETVVLGF